MLLGRTSHPPPCWIGNRLASASRPRNTRLFAPGPDAPGTVQTAPAVHLHAPPTPTPTTALARDAHNPPFLHTCFSRLCGSRGKTAAPSPSAAPFSKSPAWHLPDLEIAPAPQPPPHASLCAYSHFSSRPTVATSFFLRKEPYPRSSSLSPPRRAQSPIDLPRKSSPGIQKSTPFSTFHPNERRIQSKGTGSAVSACPQTGIE
jgi:hypothetical protein